MPTRLDEIADEAEWAAKLDAKYANVTPADLAALVAVARAAVDLANGLDKGSVTHIPLRRALVPLLAGDG